MKTRRIILDGLKVTAAIFLAGQLTGGDHLAEALAGVAGVLGHNKSIFLMRRVLAKDGRTRIQINGGAGGAPAVGGAFGLWPWSLAFVLTGGLFFWLVVGYASLGTLAVGLVTITVFLIRAIFFNGPWEYVVYGVLCLVLQVWALRPNIRRLIEGTERAHGGWAKRRAERLGAQENQSE